MNILLLIFGIICSVAVLLIFCIFYMIVETKLKDIAILKSIGAGSFNIAAIFAGFGGFIGLLGGALGILLGYIFTSNINVIENILGMLLGMKLWRSSVYMFEKIPDTVNWPDVAPIVISAILGCVIGALIPAIAAARTKPVEILRYE